MRKAIKVVGTTLAISAAAAFVLAPVTSAIAASHNMMKCYGVNACKGQSACKTAKSSCKGQNACKGKGFEMMTKKACMEKGGKVMK